MSKSYELLNHPPSYEETYVSIPGLTLETSHSSGNIAGFRSNVGRRTVSDPFGNWSLNNRQTCGSATTNQSLYGSGMCCEDNCCRSLLMIQMIAINQVVIHLPNRTPHTRFQTQTKRG